MTSDVASRTEQQLQRKVRGRPFPPGVSGCPGGVSKTYRELYADLEADLGGDLSAVERLQLDQVVGLVLRGRREKDTSARVKAVNASARLLAMLMAKHKARPAGLTLGDLLRADLDQQREAPRRAVP
jgi:hypothetical protein